MDFLSWKVSWIHYRKTTMLFRMSQVSTQSQSATKTCWKMSKLHNHFPAPLHSFNKKLKLKFFDFLKTDFFFPTLPFINIVLQAHHNYTGATINGRYWGSLFFASVWNKKEEEMSRLSHFSAILTENRRFENLFRISVL